jgi:anti-sigma regulatory factor (Ser/Thr protein kinase)
MGPASDTITAWLEENKIPPDAALLANLAIEELVTNSVKYGYADTDEHLIDVEMRVADGRLVVHVIDDGRAFNPLEAPAPDLSQPIDERPVGGLGLHLLRTLSDTMTYERRNHLNCVTLVKRLES